MIRNNSISVIIPVYNEIELIKKSFKVIDSFLNKYFQDYEIIIIESGSTDGSNRVCDDLLRKYNSLKVIHEEKRNGFGSALQLGFKKAEKELVWMITADLAFPLETILKAYPLFEKYDCVLSYRRQDKRKFQRKMFSLIYNKTIKKLLNVEVKHINSAFKVYKRKVIQALPITSAGWFVDAEIIYWLKMKKIRTAQIPVSIKERRAGKSKISIRTIFSLIYEIWKFMKKNNVNQSIFNYRKSF